MLNYNHLIAMFVALGSLTYGFSLAVIGSVLGLDSFLVYFDLKGSGPQSKSILGATSALFAGGCAIGALLTTYLADQFGRVKSLIGTCVLCIISNAIQGGSVHVAMFLVGRLFNGIGVGLMLALVPLYQCEIAPAEARGQMVASHGLLIVSGHALAAWTGYGCYFSKNEAFQWRFELSAQAIWPLLLLFGMPWLPESPRWLMERGYHENALAVLEKLRNNQTAGLTVHEEFTQMSQQMAIDKRMQKKTGRFPLLTIPSYRKRLLFGCLTQFLCQSTGVLVVNNHQVMLYNGLGPIMG